MRRSTVEVIARQLFDCFFLFFLIGFISLYLLSDIQRKMIGNNKLFSDSYLFALSIYLSAWFLLTGRSRYFSFIGFCTVSIFDRFLHAYFFGFNYYQLFPIFLILFVYYFVPKIYKMPTTSI
jgi:hypothetical protein